MIKEMTNKEIYEIAIDIYKNLNIDELKLPIKIGFYIQKNLKTFSELGREIESIRAKVFNTYGVYSEEEDKFVFDEESLKTAEAEIEDLYNIKQNVEIYTVSLSDFRDVRLPSDTIKSLLFMIKEE